MSKFFTNILTEANGDFSSTRVILLVWFIPLIVLWVISCVVNRKLVDIPNGVYMLSMVIAGMKAGQKFGEEKTGETK